MIDKINIERLVGEFIKGTGIFLVAVKVSSSGKITILADREENITIDDCVDISRHIEKNINRDEEDYELQVSSPGLESPFLVIEQFRKNEGKKVEVTNTEGIKYSGTLKNVTPGGFEIETETRIKGKGKELKDRSFNFDEVKSTKAIILFK